LLFGHTNGLPLHMLEEAGIFCFCSLMSIYGKLKKLLFAETCNLNLISFEMENKKYYDTQTKTIQTYIRET